MKENNLIKPKLSGEELEIFRQRLDCRGGMIKAAKATGLTRVTISRIMLAGTGSDKSIEKIRKFISEHV